MATYKSVASILQAVYPVGSVYIATVSTNPATLLGFGTWVAYGEGRVIVGKAASGTFVTAGATGGAEAHTLTIGEMPAHTHDIPTFYGGGGTLGVQSYDAQNSGATRSTTSQGGGGSHNNLQPYIVAYMWNRTA